MSSAKASTSAHADPSSAAVDEAPHCEALTSSVELLAEAPGSAAFATDGKQLFVSDGHAIYRREVASGEFKTIVRDAASASEVVELRVDSGELWIRSKRDFSRGCLGSLAKAQLDGTQLKLVGPAGCIQSFDLNRTTVVTSDQTTSLGIGSLESTLRAIPRNGGKSLVLRRNLNGTTAVAVDEERVFFADDIGKIAHMPIADGPIVRITEGNFGGALQDPSADHFSLDASHVYFFHGHTNFSGMRLTRMNKEGGRGEFLMPAMGKDKAYPRGRIIVAGGYVYFSSPAENLVMRIDTAGMCPSEFIHDKAVRPDFVDVREGAIYWLESEKPPRIMRRKL